MKDAAFLPKLPTAEQELSLQACRVQETVSSIRTENDDSTARVVARHHLVTSRSGTEKYMADKDAKWYFGYGSGENDADGRTKPRKYRDALTGEERETLFVEAASDHNLVGFKKMMAEPDSDEASLISRVRILKANYKEAFGFFTDPKTSKVGVDIEYLAVVAQIRPETTMAFLNSAGSGISHGQAVELGLQLRNLGVDISRWSEQPGKLANAYALINGSPVEGGQRGSEELSPSAESFDDGGDDSSTVETLAIAAKLLAEEQAARAGRDRILAEKVRRSINSPRGSEVGEKVGDSARPESASKPGEKLDQGGREEVRLSVTKIFQEIAGGSKSLIDGLEDFKKQPLSKQQQFMVRLVGQLEEYSASGNQAAAGWLAENLSSLSGLRGVAPEKIKAGQINDVLDQLSILFVEVE